MERIPEQRLEPPPEPLPVEPICPVCGKACDTFHMNKIGDIVGCDRCLSAVDAVEWVNA